MVKLDDIIEALQETSQEIDFYYNPDNKEIFMSNIGDYEDLNEDELDELFAKSIMLPTRYEINEYSMMESFIETIDDKTIHNQLLIAINGPGTFRRFKDTCLNFDIIEKWYKFRDEKYKRIAIDWCNKNNIDYE